jgi:HEPN domain-containing protein
MGPQRSPEETRRRAASAWFADAGADLATAKSVSVHREEGTAPFAAAFHAQQVVEKGLKAILIWHAAEYPPKHDIGLLVGLLPAGSRTKELTIAGLTVYAVDQRYVAGASNPMEMIDRPTWDEADEAIAVAERALAVMRADLESAGWRLPTGPFRP